MQFVTFFSLFVASATALVLPRQALLLPSQDPFYTQPSNIASYSPGQIINKRDVTSALSGLLPDTASVSNLKKSYQYLYRTTDSLGNPVAAVTTLLIPNNANVNKLLSYQTAYDSANNNCSPSYGLRQGANVTEVADIYFINEALDRGWYVMTADFEGLQAQFSAGVMSGYATLDSVRVAFNDASSTGLSSSAKYALWGYSGGSIACEWAAELQPKYAPELNFQGAALGGLIPNVKNVVMTINNGIFSGLAFSGTYGLAKAYPDALAYLQQQLIPSKSADFYNIANGCLTQSVLGGAVHDLYSYLQSGMAAFNSPPVAAAINAGGIMGTHGVPKMPIFAYKAIGDEISPAADTTALVNKLCSEGTTIEYQLNTVGEHFTELLLGAGSAIEWVDDRLNGKAVTNQGKCVTEMVTITAVDPVAFADLGAEAIAFLQSLL